MTTTSASSSSSAFTLSYDGPALLENTISVRDLAPALASIGDLLDRSNHLLFDNTATIDLKLASTRPGSYEVDLLLQMGFVASNLLTSPLVVSALNLRQMMIMTIGLYKRLRGSHAVQPHEPTQEIIPAMEHIEVNIGGFEMTVDGSADTIETVAREALRLVKDPLVLRAAQGMVEPVRRDGISRMSIKDKTRGLEEVSKAHLASFETPIIESSVSERIVRQPLGIISAHFRMGPMAAP